MYNEYLTEAVNELKVMKLIDKDDVNLNIDRWIDGELNNLYIMGIGGSGKTYQGKLLAEASGAYFIELDMVFLELRRKYGESRIGMKRAPEFTSEKFIEYLEAMKKKHGQLIVEGVHLRAIDIEYLVKTGAFIIKQTSLDVATDRAMARQEDKERQANFGEKRSREEWYEINKRGKEIVDAFEKKVRENI